MLHNNNRKNSLFPTVGHDGSRSIIERCAMPLTLSQESGDFSLVAFEGELGLGVFGHGVDPLEELVGQDVHRRTILLDLSRTSYIDSSGVSWLVKQHKLCLEAKGMLIIHSVPPAVMSVFKLLHLDRLLKFAEDGQSARTMAVGRDR